jgi:hypothetical protein
MQHLWHTYDAPEMRIIVSGFFLGFLLHSLLDCVRSHCVARQHQHSILTLVEYVFAESRNLYNFFNRIPHYHKSHACLFAA